MMTPIDKSEGPTTSRLSCTLIVPVHRLDASFLSCVEALSQLDPRPDEIWFSLNGCHLEQPPLPGTQFLNGSPQPTCPATARNAGAGRAAGDILIFVDSDVLVPKDMTSRIREYFEKYPEVTALFGSYDSAPSAKNFVSQARHLLHHYVHQSARQESHSFWTGLGAVRRSAFVEVGRFDETLRMLEDVELGTRLKRAGHRIHVLKDLTGSHAKRLSLGQSLWADVFDRAAPWTRLLLEDKVARTADLNLRPGSLIALSFSLALYPALALLPSLGAVPLLVVLAGWLFVSRTLLKFIYQRRGARFAFGFSLFYWAHLNCAALGATLGLLLWLWAGRLSLKTFPSPSTSTSPA